MLRSISFVVFAFVGLTVLSVDAAPPKVNYLFPAGANRGATVVVTAFGEFSTWPVNGWASQPGVTIAAEKDKGKLKVTVADNATPGLCWLRVFNADGASTPRPFVIGTLTEVNEVEPNDSHSAPQVLTDSTTINGRLEKVGDVDSFAIWLTRGQTLVASMQANSELASPMDGVMQICELPGFDPKSNSNLPERRGLLEANVLEHVDDTVGVDPRIATTISRDGWYLVRVFGFPIVATSRIGYGGGDDFVYRLTVTTRGFVDHCLPLAVPKNQSVDLKLFGWNLSDETITLPAPTSTEATSALPAFGKSVAVFRGEAAGGLSLPVIETENVVAAPQRPADKTATRITIPATISGRIAVPRNQDVFEFEASKGDKIRFQIESRSLGFDLDPAIAITNQAGVVVAEMDDAARDQRDVDLKFTVLADGTYRLAVRDIFGHGGLRYAYRLFVSKLQPTFTASLAADAFVLVGEKPLEIPVTVARLDGFNQPIRFQVEGLPKGVTASEVTSAPTGDTAKAIKIKLTAEKDVEPFDGLIRIVANTEGKVTLSQTAKFAATEIGQEIWLTVRASAK